MYLIPAEPDTPTEKALKTDMLNSNSSRYTEKSLEHLSKELFLDPHFKSLGFLSEEEWEATQSMNVQEAAVVNVMDAKSHLDEPQPKRSQWANKLQKLLEDSVDFRPEVDAGPQEQWADKELHN